MIRSMTGFGHGEVSNDKNQKVTVEMKSVNHRYCDISLKLPKKLAMFEANIRNIMKEYASRGKIDIYVSYEDLYRTNLITYNKIKNINKGFFAQYKLCSLFYKKDKFIKMKFIKVIGEKNKFNVKDQNYIQLNIPTAYYISYSINIITNSPIYKLSSFFILNKKIIKESLFEVSNYNIYSNSITITMTSGCIIICANPEDELSLVINNYYKSKVSIVSGKVCIISIY